MTRTRGLGRGLGALIPTADRNVDEVDVDLIVPNPQQPRTMLNDEALDELVASVREHGVLQPLLVSSGESEGVYQLIAGERRLRAARLAGLERVPVVVREATSRELLELALVENLQREDLGALEEAEAFRRLADEFGMSQEEIGTRVGRSRTAVANAMRLLGLDADVKQSLAGGEISEGHARALLGLTNERARLTAWRRVVDGGLTVRQTEELVRDATKDGKGRSAKPAATRDVELTALEDRIRLAVGTKVELRRARDGRGRLVLHFFSDDELNGLLERLGVEAR